MSSDFKPLNCQACLEGAELPFEFKMAFQPILRVSDRSVLAQEALCRGPAGEGAMHVFTREFVHPGDREEGGSGAAIERFWTDGCCFPEPAYEANSCLWKQDIARQPDSAERLSIHGLPSGCLDKAVTLQNLGNVKRQSGIL